METGPTMMMMPMTMTHDGQIMITLAHWHVCQMNQKVTLPGGVTPMFGIKVFENFHSIQDPFLV